MSVRAKFKVTKITPGQDGLKSVELQAVVDGSPENKSFFRWTPSGTITLGIVNPAASDQFVEGGEYYVDFSSAPKLEEAPAPAPVVG
jgi:hypothetical protein